MIDDLKYRKCKALRELLDGPLMKEAVADVNAMIINEVLQTEPEEKDKREALYNESKIFNKLIGRLQSIAHEATVAERYEELNKRRGVA